MFLRDQFPQVGLAADTTAEGGGGSPGPRRLLLVDDHPVFRAGLKQFLDFQAGLSVVGDAPDLTLALALAEELRPDLILLDLSLKDASGLELFPLLRGRGLAMPVVVVSMHEEDHHVEQARRAGAAGYAMKARGPTDLLATVQRVLVEAYEV